MTESLTRDNNYWQELAKVANEQNAPESRDYRTGYGQTAYKRQLAYERLGIDPAHVPCKPFFRASLKRIARLMNRARPKGEVERDRQFGPFDCLQASADPDACKLSSMYRSVPESYRRLLPPEAFCYAAGVPEARALELIVGAMARHHVEASAIVAAVWHPAVADRVKALPERHEVGRAISTQDEKGILAAASQSRSPALLPLIVFSIDTGMRLGETQALRRENLSLVWKDGAIQRGEVTVPSSKTAAGTGRVIPLSHRVCACLSLWLERFANAGPDSFLFPHHKVGFSGNSRLPVLWDIDLSRPMGSWRKA